MCIHATVNPSQLNGVYVIGLLIDIWHEDDDLVHPVNPHLPGGKAFYTGSVPI